MKVKLFAPVVCVSLGFALAAGCGNSGADMTEGGPEAGADVGASTGDSSAPDGGDNGGADSGKDGGDGSIDVPGTEVPVQYGSCAVFTPCGGSPVGTWTYAAGGCLEAIDLAACPAATITNPDIKVKGQTIFTGTATSGTVSRTARIDVRATAFVPFSCTTGLPCNLVELGLTTPPPTGGGMDSAKCTAKNDGCECDIAKTSVDKGSDTYAVAGNVLTIGGVPGARSYEFCVNPTNKFTYQETLPIASQKATLVMTK